MSEHSPFPWHYVLTYDGPYKGEFRLFAEDDRVLAFVPVATSEESRLTDIANIRLMVAAPDLLRTCKEAWAYALEAGISAMEGGSELIQMLKDGIAKAEGKSHE